MAGLRGRALVAYLLVCIVWGSTYLAIRIGVQELPPLLFAGVRFLIAGALLAGLVLLTGGKLPTRPRDLGVLAVVGLFLLLGGNAVVVWAEQFVESGPASVFVAAVALGFSGVAWLLIRSDQPFPGLPCIVILAGGAAWSLGAVLTRSLPRPKSVPLAAGAQMMLGGAVLLALSQATGELHSFPHISLRAGLALAYLIVAGSLLGFTAYVWLLARMPATQVASHAYVNPLVAVALGYFVAGEALTVPMMLASALVLASVLLILKTPDVRERRVTT